MKYSPSQEKFINDSSSWLYPTSNLQIHRKIYMVLLSDLALDYSLNLRINPCLGRILRGLNELIHVKHKDHAGSELTFNK